MTMLEDAGARPYLIRAVYDWCMDKGYRPHVLANWDAARGRGVPPQLVAHGKVMFNISGDAVRHLVIDDHGMSFTARFHGRTVEVHVPLADVVSIFARELETGITFPPLAADESEDGGEAASAREAAGEGPGKKTAADNIRIL